MPWEGDGASKEAPIHIVSDSLLPFGHDADGTQLPVSPKSLLTTDAALETLKDLDRHEHQKEEEVKCAKGLETDEVGLDNLFSGVKFLEFHHVYLKDL